MDHRQEIKYLVSIGDYAGMIKFMIEKKRIVYKTKIINRVTGHIASVGYVNGDLMYISKQVKNTFDSMVAAGELEYTPRLPVKIKVDNRTTT